MINPIDDIVGIIPIKEHSERVPEKNFRKLGGALLWMYPVARLDGCGVVNRIVINTDCPDRIERIVSSIPIEIDVRDPELCGDDVSMNRIIADVVRRYPANIYVQTHATNPFVSVQTILRAVGIVKSGTAESVFSVTRHQSRFYDADGKAINHDRTKLIKTQDLPPLFEENSAVYVFTRSAFAATGRRICGLRCPMEIPAIEAIDIDDEDDWKLASLLAEALSKNT